MILNEIKCHVNTFLGLVGGCIPYIPPCVRACLPPVSYATDQVHFKHEQPQVLLIESLCNNQGCGSGYFVNRFRFHTYRFHFQQNLDSNRAWALSHL